MSNDKIIIKGARQHNLKNIDLELPKGKLIVFTGISGSGKSTILNKIKEKHTNIVTKDLDDFDDEAKYNYVNNLNNTNFSFDNWNNKDEKATLKIKQQLINNYLERHKDKKVLFAGLEGGIIDDVPAKLKLPTKNKIMINTSPFMSAVRRYWRNYIRNPFTKIPEDWRLGKIEQEGLMARGYKPLNPNQILEQFGKT